MRSIWLFGFLALFLAGPASAQSNVGVNCSTGTSSTGAVLWAPASPTNPCPVTTVGGSPLYTIPPPITAYGTLSVTTSSVALSTLTVGPNSPAWTTTLPNKYVTVRNSVNSTAVLYFCGLGGTCTSSVGEPIAIGETIVRQLASPATPTLICGTASACTAIAEE